MRAILGNLAIDKLFFEGGKESPGGPPYFIAQALLLQGLNDINIVSCIGEDFDINFFPLIKNVRLYPVRTKFTARVGIKKDEQGQEYGFLMARPGKISINSIPMHLKKSEIVYVSTILDEVTLEDLDFFRDSMVSLDIQGFIRNPSHERWSRKEWSLAKDYIKRVTILKMSDYEMKFFPLKFEEAFKDTKLKVILVTLGKKGIVACSRDKYYYMPALARKVVNPVGAGDYILTCFSEEYYKTKNIQRALIDSSVKVANFLEGGNYHLPNEEVNKKIRVTKNLYIP